MVTCETCGEALPEAIRCSTCFELHPDKLNQAIDDYYYDVSVSDPDCDTYRTNETFREKTKEVFSRVEDVAKNGAIAQYPDIWGDGVDVYAMKWYLGAVSEIEHRDGRPLLTSVVVKNDRGYPSNGYFSLVERLERRWGRISAPAEGNRKAWAQEQIQQVHDCWSSREEEVASFD